MDRISDSDSEDAGSIPAGATFKLKPEVVEISGFFIGRSNAFCLATLKISMIGKKYTMISAEGASTARIKGVKTNPSVTVSVLDIKGNLLARYDYQNIEYKDGFYATW